MLRWQVCCLSPKSLHDMCLSSYPLSSYSPPPSPYSSSNIFPYRSPPTTTPLLPYLSTNIFCLPLYLHFLYTFPYNPHPLPPPFTIVASSTSLPGALCCASFIFLIHSLRRASQRLHIWSRMGDLFWFLGATLMPKISHGSLISCWSTVTGHRLRGVWLRYSKHFIERYCPTRLYASLYPKSNWSFNVAAIDRIQSMTYIQWCNAI